jgi:glycosyltransferase involved in cell wall biosynthesis
MTQRVAYIHYVPTVSGAAISLGLLLQHLDRSRFEPVVIQVHRDDGPVRQHFAALGVEYHHVPIPLVWNLPWLSGENFRSQAWRAFDADTALAKRLGELAPALVHVNDFPAVAAAYTSSQILDLPTLCHCRAVLPQPGNPLYPSGKILRLMEQVADRIVAIAEPETRQFARRDVDTVFNPFDFSVVDRTTVAVADIRRELRATKDDFLVIAPVQLTEDKGAWDFLAACAHARRLAPGVNLRFALVGTIPSPGRRQLLRKWTKVLGPRPAAERAARMLRDGHIEDVFTLTGYRDNVHDYFRAADLVVFPSHLRACGRPCFEAGAFGKPILVTMPHKETRVVLEGETGFILPERDPATLGEAIVRLAGDRPLARRLGEAGWQHVRKHFDAGSHAARIMEIYDEMLAPQPAAVPQR